MHKIYGKCDSFLSSFVCAASQDWFDHTGTDRPMHCEQRYRAANSVADHETERLVDSGAERPDKAGIKTVIP